MSEHGEGQPTREALLARVSALEGALTRAQARLALIAQVDDALEEAILHKWPVAQTLTRLLPEARAALRADALIVRTFDEVNQPVQLADPMPATLDDATLDALCEQVAREGELHTQREGRALLGYRLDVTDVYLGTVVVAVHEALGDHEISDRMADLRAWSEQVDNYLAAIADARRKHEALRALSDALRSPILDVGLDEAVRLLRRFVPYRDLALALRYEDSLDRHTLNYRVRCDEVWHGPGHQDARATRDGAVALLRGDLQPLKDTLSLAPQREESMALGRDGNAIVRVSVGVDEGGLTPFARDVLDRFTDYIRLRVVDFNKEWKRLSHHFPREVVRRLLQQEEYVESYLRPREREVAILYCDISGFTRLSEQILQEPALIGQLIDAWSARVVDFIWQSGGVFDKMVGDCIIGLWGPPLFELTPQQACQRAAHAARQIRDYTRALPSLTDVPALTGRHDLEVGVATGLNYCPLFVGTFGPDESYTGFSSGMNNTARLQGLATRDEILCMEAFARTLDAPEAFGPLRSAHVKNVAEPLRFMPLLGMGDA